MNSIPILLRSDHPVKLHCYLGLAKLYNRLFHNRIHIAFYLLLLGFCIFLVLTPITHEWHWGFILYIEVVVSILTFSTIRLSNNTIYNRITKHLSMNIRDFKTYHQFNYVQDKKIVAERFKEEFIQAFEYAHKHRYKKIRMTTHQWVLNHVLMDPRVSSLFKVQYIEKKARKIPLEVVLLASPDTIRLEPSKLLSEALRTRKQYKVTMKIKALYN